MFFGISDITGAYFAGLILCNLTDIRNYIVTRICIISYMFFTPIFFAGIGMKTEVAGMFSIVFTFSLILLIGAVLSKVIGCGLGAKLCRYENKEAFPVGKRKMQSQQSRREKESLCAECVLIFLLVQKSRR